MQKSGILCAFQRGDVSLLYCLLTFLVRLRHLKETYGICLEGD
jgi:hypothetical protein